MILGFCNLDQLFFTNIALPYADNLSFVLPLNNGPAYCQSNTLAIWR